MAADEEDSEDLYDDEFDFVDEDESDIEEDAGDQDAGNVDEDLRFEDEPAQRPAVAKRPPDDDRNDTTSDREDEKVDEFGRPEPVANYVVHIYEFRDFKRTIDRPFTPEDAEAFASEFNRTSKSYGRFAVTGKNDAKPRKSLD